MINLSERDYWDEGYRRSDRGTDLPDLRNFRQLPGRRLVEALEALDLRGKDVLELGAGDSDILLVLARRWSSTSKFFGLDYSTAGCVSLRRRAEIAGVDVSVVQADMFSPSTDLARRFDIVYSVGLVEHFSWLDQALTAKQRFLKPGGVMLTVIPNLSGLYGKLTERFNKAVYEIHNPHDLRSFLIGHARANLAVVRSGYLCSTNFGMLAACFTSSKQRGWKLYVLLCRLSKTLWFFESRIVELPKTAFLSPYIYAVSRIATEAVDVIQAQADPIHGDPVNAGRQVS